LNRTNDLVEFVGDGDGTVCKRRVGHASFA
jgi:hypothetical protein